ncbi:MAG: mechanosensitive ion channel family protein [Bacteroidetes bacterium]|nr:mechanosensitive ion channel family protein [Bacteroidota bacterium]MBS1931707.1 mechanosensitive ion channel family protein [Bacteroidota bacterium]
MNDFLQQVWLDNPVKNYLIVLGIILFVLFLKRVISRYLAGLLSRLINKVWKNVDRKSFIGLVVQPLGFFLLILVSLASLHRLKFPHQLNIEVYEFTVHEVFLSLGSLVLIISFIWLLLRVIDFIAVILEKRANQTKDQSDNQLIVFFKDFLKVIIVIIGILMVMSFSFGMDVRNFLAGLSLVGAAIALALRESLENLIASFIIFFDKPFGTGDVVKVLNITGTIEKIGLRSTRIRTDQKTYVTVPNKQMVDTVLDNLSLRTQRKGELRIEAELSTSSEKLQELLKGIKAILKNEKTESYTVLLDSITMKSFMVNGDYFTAPVTQDEFNSIKEEINLSVLKLMESLGIKIAGASSNVYVIGQQ